MRTEIPQKAEKGKGQKKPTRVLKNVRREDQRGCRKNNIRAQEEQRAAARMKQHEDEEEVTGIRPGGR